MGKPEELPVDSKEGIEHLVRWARSGRFVLNETHEAIALKHGVSTEGVVICRLLPVGRAALKESAE